MYNNNTVIATDSAARYAYTNGCNGYSDFKILLFFLLFLNFYNAVIPTGVEVMIFIDLYNAVIATDPAFGKLFDFLRHCGIMLLSN